MDRDDPTIPDRLILRSLIEAGLPHRAREQGWPIRQPLDFARLIFDPLVGAPFELHVAEPVFENFPAAKLSAAVKMALSLMEGDSSRLGVLMTAAAPFREPATG